MVNGVEVTAYRPDFTYVDSRSGQEVVEDVKGLPGMTEVYRLKKLLLLACRGIEITEVRSVRGRR